MCDHKLPAGSVSEHFQLFRDFRNKGRVFILEAKSVNISYGKNIIFDDASFCTHEGCGAAILGKNGSGKSTFLKALSGVRKVDGGEVLLDGLSVYSKEVQRNIGFVPQNDIAFPELSVKDNLIFWGAVYGLDKKRSVTNPVAALLGLDEVLKVKAKRLSGGMRKRLCIAASLLHNPRVLILDEPFSAVDIVAKQELLQYLLNFKNEGKIIVITSHNASELTALCSGFYRITGKLIKPVEITDEADGGTEESVANIIMQGD